MKRNMYTLVLKVERSVAKSDEVADFEPLSWWISQEDGTYHVHQKVYLDGGRLFGETDRYQEGLSDVVRDFDRFVSLTPIKE
jgi:hypothetical protein